MTLAQQQPDNDEIPAPRPPGDARLFAFNHPLFSMKGSYFRMGADGVTPLYYACLGDTHAAIHVDHLPRSFDIPSDSQDARLIALAAQGLRYVHEIWPGDSIPSELLDGSASWNVTDRDVEAAKARFTMQLISWLNGRPMATLNGRAFADILQAPDTKAKLQGAFGMIAERLGLGVERKQEVVDKIDTLAREFSYIEALRGRFFHVRKIVVNLKTLSGAYRRERSIHDDIGRALSLINPPIQKLSSLFDQIDANTEDLIAMLKKFEETTNYIRRMRDELHQQLIKWDDLVRSWKNATTERSPINDRIVRQTYQFVAKHFPQKSDW